MTISLGRIEPPRTVDPGPGDPDGPPSARVLQDLHRDLVAQKRRAFVKTSPFLLLSAFAWFGAMTDPGRFGGLAFFSMLTAFMIGRVGYEWLTLRRADPLELYHREQRLEAERQRRQIDHLARSAAVRPFASLALVAGIVAVTVVQFAMGPLRENVAAAGLVKPAVRAGEWWRLLSASFLHGNLFHLVANCNALLMLGRLIETYDRRLRIPLVYLLAAIGGNVLSTLLTSKPAVGASGGVIGLAGYLLVVAGRDPDGAPAWIRRQMLSILASTAVLGIAAFIFIDNAAHLGGALTGALIGFVLTRPRWKAHERELRWAGLIAAALLIAGAAFTIRRLAPG